jgi:hypothetical protein
MQNNDEHTGILIKRGRLNPGGNTIDSSAGLN